MTRVNLTRFSPALFRKKNEGQNLVKLTRLYGDTWACIGTRCQAPKQKSEMRPFQNGAGRSQNLSKAVSPAICTISLNTSVGQRCFARPRRPQPLGCNSSQESPRKTHVLMMSPGGRSAIRLNNIICLTATFKNNIVLCSTQYFIIGDTADEGVRNAYCANKLPPPRKKKMKNLTTVFPGIREYM